VDLGDGGWWLVFGVAAVVWYDLGLDVIGGGWGCLGLVLAAALIDEECGDGCDESETENYADNDAGDGTC
jgi:hypothetical protein